jgi:hypothetical protein
MSRSFGGGRLGNQIIRNLACSLVSEKFDLYTEYTWHNMIHKLGISLYIGTNKYNNTIVLNDSNYFDTFNKFALNANIMASDYFQTRQITNLIYIHLHKESVKSSVVEANPFNERYSKNNDIYIHLRLDDAKQWSPGLEYYFKAIEAVGVHDNIYLSTDEKEHVIVKQILERYPKARILEFEEIHTIQFASTCKNIILSHGSFSAIIGYLAYYSNMTYPDYSLASVGWFGDMFSIDGWNKLTI